MKNEANLRQRLKIFTGLFVLGLVLSGLTAIPIVTQFNVGRYWFGAIPLWLCRRWAADLKTLTK